MKPIPPPWDRLMKAYEVRVGAFWELRKTHAREFSIHTYRRAWRHDELKKFRYRTPGWQAQERWIRAVAAPVIVYSDDDFFQLLGDHVELDVLWRPQPSIIWDLLYKVPRPSVRHVIGHWIANARDLSKLRVARVPLTYRMPSPVAAWLCRSLKRLQWAGWDQKQLRRWASSPSA